MAFKGWFQSPANQTEFQPVADNCAGVFLSMQQMLQCQKEAAALSRAPKLKQQALLAGGHESRFKGRGMDFDETRLYQPGDDIRAIDWNVTARTNKPHTKIYREERERPIHILLDQSNPMFFSSRKALKSTTLAQAAALLTWAGVANKNRVGSILVDEYSHLEFRPAAQRRQIMRMFNAMVDRHNQKVDFLFGDDAHSYSEKPTLDWFSRGLGRLKQVARPGSLVYILSDFRDMDEAAKRQLANIARHCDVHAFAISDPLETRLPPNGRYAITDGEQVQVISTHGRSIRDSFSTQAENFNRSLQEFCLKHRISLVQFKTSQNLTEVMRNSLVNFQLTSRRGG